MLQDERRENFDTRVAVLLEALPYIRDFSGDTIVVKYGGSAMITPELQASFARDIALLKLVGMNPVVVHGGGPAISRYSDRLGLEVRFVEGLRVTNAETMELAKMVLVGKTSKEIARSLELSYRTVEVHRARLLKKFGVANTAGLFQSLGDIGGDHVVSSS